MMERCRLLAMNLSQVYFHVHYPVILLLSANPGDISAANYLFNVYHSLATVSDWFFRKTIV